MTDHNDAYDPYDDDSDFEPPPNPIADAIYAAEDTGQGAIANYYARVTAGSAKPYVPHPGYGNLAAAWAAGLARKEEAYRRYVLKELPPTEPDPDPTPQPVQLSLLDPPSS